jgi:hypothetical protein
LAGRAGGPIAEALQQKKQEGCSNPSVDLMLAQLRSVMNKARRWGLLEGNVPEVKQSQGFHARGKRILSITNEYISGNNHVEASEKCQQPNGEEDEYRG